MRKIQYIKLGVILLLGVSLYQPIAFSNKSIISASDRIPQPYIKTHLIMLKQFFST